MARTIPAGAGVRCTLTGRLGCTLLARRMTRGLLLVRWDGDLAAGPVERRNVSLVADRYDVAKAWTAKAAT